MAGPAAWIAARKTTLLIHNTLPRQFRTGEVRDAADDPCSTCVTAKRGELTVRHDAHLWDLRHKRLYPLPEIWINFFHSQICYSDDLLTRDSASCAWRVA